MFYCLRNEAIPQKVMRRLRPYDVRLVLDARFRNVDATDVLSDVQVRGLGSLGS